MSETRTEKDTFGPIEVPASALWAAQTQRSLQFFAIGEQRMPPELISALALVKCAAARTNQALGGLDETKADAIADAAARVADGEYAEHFPLSVWQTGSGTQTNMNVNEVIANLASEALGGGRGGERRIHPNDEVNMGQSSNDVFPTAMHVAVAAAASARLLPALRQLRDSLAAKAEEYQVHVKIGRTHLQDATPVTLGQEFSGYAAQLSICETAIEQALGAVQTLAIGGTAVGTGLNTHPEFGRRVAAWLGERLGIPFRQADNLFAAMAGQEALTGFHGALKTLAAGLTKIGNDIRLMGSGPRAGLGELQLPENEPGSSIMPGKVNPTQVEALTMVCIQVMGHDAAIGFASSQGHFELNVYKPLIAYDTLDSIRLLSDAMRSFAVNCVDGIQVNVDRVGELLQRSLMLVTALNPHIGYDRSAKIAKHAHKNGISLREAALEVGGVTGEQFDAWVVPSQMLGQGG